MPHSYGYSKNSRGRAGRQHGNVDRKLAGQAVRFVLGLSASEESGRADEAGVKHNIRA